MLDIFTGVIARSIRRNGSQRQWSLSDEFGGSRRGLDAKQWISEMQKIGYGTVQG